MIFLSELMYKNNKIVLIFLFRGRKKSPLYLLVNAEINNGPCPIFKVQVNTIPDTVCYGYNILIIY